MCKAIICCISLTVLLHMNSLCIQVKCLCYERHYIVVKLDHKAILLAIGDGANDVSMI